LILKFPISSSPRSSDSSRSAGRWVCSGVRADGESNWGSRRNDAQAQARESMRSVEREPVPDECWMNSPDAPEQITAFLRGFEARVRGGVLTLQIRRQRRVYLCSISAQIPVRAASNAWAIGSVEFSL